LIDAMSLFTLLQSFPSAQVICHREKAPFVTGEKHYADLHTITIRIALRPNLRHKRRAFISPKLKMVI
jgi:hypothetical protein